MKQENFLFVDVVSSIFLLILMMGNFMGLLYITSGNYAISLLISLFIVVCYYFIIQVLKKNKEIMVNKKYATPASLFFIVFLVFGFVSFVLMTHTLNIELNFKKKIQEEADQKIEKVKQLSEIYNTRANDDLLNYEGNLTQKLNA
jgi:asparagine N-glycosylation enzyme membrane subunit Stt3